MSSAIELYSELVGLLQGVELLGSCSSVLSWDEQTYMPPGGAEHRANQLGYLAGLTHERRIAPRIGELLAELENSGNWSDPHADEPVNVREARRVYDRATKLPQKLVEELSRTTSLAQQCWISARKTSDFAAFQPWLAKVIALKREEAAAIGSDTGVAYDALLDDYEPGMTTAEITAVFEPLRAALVPLVSAIRQAPRQPRTEIVQRRFPKGSQREFLEVAARKIGFDFDRGRIDESAHPFCSGFGPGDCRLTTRFDEHHFNSAFFGTLHEAGHGIYEQGLCVASLGLGVGQACSLGIHESQSRMWENFVGRSRSFWEFFYPQAQRSFPEALSDISLDEFHFAINDVRPSYIRVEADEVTYNLHIMLRFELEQRLLAGELETPDLPDAWNSLFQKSFDMTPPDAARGCMQDVHWSAGLLGYFPTYALGNMYAAQFFEAAHSELGNFNAMFASGEFSPLKGWLNEKIHRHGKRYPARQLVEVVTGQKLSHVPLVEQLTSKFVPLYGC